MCNTEGYVYLLKSHVGWKIGYTKNPADRRRTFEVKFPVHFEFEHLIKCYDMNRMERRLHKKYKAKRTGGEFFDLDTDDVAYIKTFATQDDYDTANGYTRPPAYEPITPVYKRLPVTPVAVTQPAITAHDIIQPLIYPIMKRVVFAVIFMFCAWSSYLTVFNVRDDIGRSVYIMYTLVSAVVSVLLVWEVWLILRHESSKQT